LYYDGNEKSKRCMEKCGFKYHHSEENKPCELMGDIRTEHFLYLTKEEWGRITKKAVTGGDNYMYLISAYFDEKSNKIIQELINRIAEATGNAFMTEHKVPPHMTVSSIEARNGEVLLPAFESLKGRLYTGEIQFVSIGQLLPYVMYATPVLNKYLQEMIESVYEAVKDIDMTNVSKFYRPNSWVPHVTLGKTLEKEQMIKAFEVLQKSFVPFNAKITELGLAKVNPHEDIDRFCL